MPTVKIKKAVKKVEPKKAVVEKAEPKKKPATVKKAVAPVKKAAPKKVEAVKKAPVKKAAPKKGFLGKANRTEIDRKFKFGCENIASLDQLAYALLQRLNEMPEYTGATLKDAKLIIKLFDDVLYEAVIENHNKFVLPKSRISAKVSFRPASVKKPPLAVDGELTYVDEHYEVGPVKKKKLGKRENIISYGKISKDGKKFITTDGRTIKIENNKKPTIDEKDYCEIMKEATSSTAAKGKAPAKKKTVKTAAKDKSAKAKVAAVVAEEDEDIDEDEEVEEEIEETTVDEEVEDEEIEDDEDSEDEDDESEDDEDEDDDEDDESEDDEDESIFDEDED